MQHSAEDYSTGCLECALSARPSATAVFAWKTAKAVLATRLNILFNLIVARQVTEVCLKVINHDRANSMPFANFYLTGLKMNPVITE